MTAYAETEHHQVFSEVTAPDDLSGLGHDAEVLTEVDQILKEMLGKAALKGTTDILPTSPFSNEDYHWWASLPGNKSLDLVHERGNPRPWAGVAA